MKIMVFFPALIGILLFIILLITICKIFVAVKIKAKCIEIRKELLNDERFYDAKMFRDILVSPKGYIAIMCLVDYHDYKNIIMMSYKHLINLLKKEPPIVHINDINGFEIITNRFKKVVSRSVDDDGMLLFNDAANLVYPIFKIGYFRFNLMLKFYDTKKPALNLRLWYTSKDRRQLISGGYNNNDYNPYNNDDYIKEIKDDIKGLLSAFEEAEKNVKEIKNGT